MNSCTAGNIFQTQCSPMESFKNLKDLSLDDYKLLKLRIEDFYKISNGTICSQHKLLLLDRYNDLQKFCCDPLKIHKKRRDTRMREITFSFQENAYKYLLVPLKPGKKLCHNCFLFFNEHIENEKKKFDQVRKPSKTTLRHQKYCKLIYLFNENSNIAIHDKG